MARLLFYLSALGLLAGAAAQVVVVPTELSISSCPITYYGRTYERVYVNFTTENFVLCFDGFYNPDAGGDCILAPPSKNSGSDYSSLDIISRVDVLETNVHNNVPTITSTMDCSLSIIISNNSRSYFVSLYAFGKETVVLTQLDYPDTLELDMKVNGSTVDTLTHTRTAEDKLRFVYMDISGCRHSGVLYRAGEVLSSDPETCTTVTCDDGAFQRSTCGPLECCQGNHTCMLDTTCTVTGPTIIDVHGQVNSVQDRCAYPLVSVPDLDVLATFQERRRTDVSFVDSVTLVLGDPAVHIHLEQDGRVRLDDSALTLNSSAQLVHGVELSKDQSGVTAKVSLSNYTTSVFFDGSTAQIRVEGAPGSPLQGLCGNSSVSLSGLSISAYSSPSCKKQYPDTADSTINCNMTSERCNLLKEAPFTTCTMDPEPYITACIDTLCTYPALDGLNCQFLEAYARACSLYSDGTLEGWRSKASCPAPEAFCQDRTCSAHEFCGERTVSGESGCLCRAIFASKYRSTNSLGDPTVCSQNSASLTLVGCLLVEKGIDFSALHLNDPDCVGQMDEETHMMTFSFNSINSCGTVFTANNSQIIYKNTIKTQNNSSDIITRQDQFSIDFSCVHTQPDIKTMAFRIRDSSVIQQITSGAWNYSLTMTAFTDAGRTQAVESNTEVLLNQKIWVELVTDGLDGNMVAVVTDSCWATDQPSPTATQKYDLIIKGCANPADQTVNVEGNGLGTSNYFSFNLFQFSGNSGDIYLHCNLQLCVKQENNCAPVCNRAVRRRRSARSGYEGEGAALISMAWTN
ncbi:uncharacterized protein LOC125008728 [Mugil cephalus]|uniref:uncharacterized protein LOC125008728 n=1 Tax=Mugil cephalus TaxID=48193 RepID=UPI001FB7050B|nr:uncharacterized protein LOC125008728 [Mugil cephalus]